MANEQNLRGRWGIREGVNEIKKNKKKFI